MHKRMMMVSRKVRAALEVLNGKGAKKNAEASRMLDHLYQSQCNDAYWHGVFGGLYLPHLRSAVYEHVIKAEYMADAALHRGQGPRGKGKKTRRPGWRSSWGILTRTGARNS